MNTLLLALLVQAAGALFLFLIFSVLLAYRRRFYFFCWTLSWLALGLASVFVALALPPEFGGADLAAWRPTLRQGAMVFGWWHAVLFAFGSYGLRRGLAGGEPPPTAARPVPLWPWLLVALTGATAVAVGLDWVLSVADRYAVTSAAIGLVYAGSAALLAQVARRPGRLGAVVPAVFLALFTLERFAFAVCLPALRAAPPSQDFASSFVFVDFVLLTFSGMGLIITLLDEEKGVLRTALQQLAESEDRFRLLFERGEVGLALLAPGGHFLQVNPALERFLGYPAAELRGRRLADLVHPEDDTQQRRLETPNPVEDSTLYEREKRFLNKNRQAVYGRVLRVPVRKPTGEVRYHVAVVVDITERKLMERALAASEQRYRLRVESAFDGVFLWNDDGAFLDANPALCRMLGYSRAELLRLGAAEVAVDPAELRRHLQQLYSREGCQFETQLQRKDGSRLHVEMSCALMEPADAPLVHGSCRDITDRQRAVEALRQSEERHRTILATASDGVLLTDPAGRILEVNAAAKIAFRCTGDALLGRLLTDLLPSRVTHHPDAREGQAAAPEPGTALDPRLFGRRVERRARRPNGTWFPAEVTVNALPQGEQHCLVAFVRDISDRLAAERTLREERDFSTQVLQTADALILVLDRSGRVVHFNGKCAQVSGWLEEEAKGRLAWEFLLPPRHAAALADEFRRLVRERTPSAFENSWQTKGGSERRIAWRASTVQDAHGHLRYVILTGLDVTDQRLLEEQLRQAQKMELLGAFVGGIAHDFRNQLVPILGNLHLLVEKLRGTDWAEPLRQAQEAERAAQRCADVVRRLLTFSRRRSGPPGPVQVNDIVEEASHLLRHVLPATIRLELQLAPDLAAVTADSTQIHQVLMNLAVNARDAMPHGGVLRIATANRRYEPDDQDAPVDVGSLRPGQFVELSVADTGAGMAPEVLARAFEPFFTTKEVGVGTGLGLPMVADIVQHHHGWITVDSRPGQGTRFCIFLPSTASGGAWAEDGGARDEKEPAADAGGADGTAAPSPPRPRGGKRILVVDDEELIRSLLRTVLQDSGYEVVTACNGEEALHAYDASRNEGQPRIDLVLLDYTMPGLTGLQVMERLRERNPDVRVICSSGFTLDVDGTQLRNAGAMAFVAKPYRPRELLQTVQDVLAQ